MATPRSRPDPADPESFDASVPGSAVPAEVLVPGPPVVSPLASAKTVTIQDVLDGMTEYLLAQYADSLTDQDAVLDAARMLDDGHVIPAWRHLARMVEQVLNVPPGG